MWMRFGIPRFLRWLCSQLRSILKHLGAVLSSQSDWASFIQQSNRVKCFLCFSFLLTLLLAFGTSPVYAQCPGPSCPTPEPTSNVPTLTPGPTATYRPLYVTGTPEPTMDYACPTGNPIGAGVVTPNPTWKFNCGHCVTEVPGYVWATVPPPAATLDWEKWLNATAAPAFTPTPVGTPIPLPIKVSNQVVGIWQDVIEGQVQTRPFSNTNDNSTSFNAYVSTGYPRTLGFRYSGVLSTYINAWVEGGQMSFQLASGAYNGAGLDIVVVSSDVVSFPAGATYHLNQNQASPWFSLFTIPPQSSKTGFSWNVEFNVTFLGANTYGSGAQFGLELDGYVYRKTSTGTTTFSWKQGPITPPPPASNCSAVNGVGAPGDPDNIFHSRFFSLPYIGVGAGSCFGIESYTIDLSAAQAFLPFLPASITTPGFEICMAPVAFGSLNIFGIPIDLDSWAIILAGVVMFKVLRTF